MVGSPIDLNVWEPKSLIKDVNNWMTFKADLFNSGKGVGNVRQTDYWRMVHYCPTYILEQYPTYIPKFFRIF